MLQVAVDYPGGYIVDSTDQLNQARTGTFNDWHPAAMAMFWRFLIQLTGTPVALFMVQWGCYWLGFGLIADGLVRSGRARTGLAVMAAALFPYLHYLNKIMSKDSQLSAALLVAFGLIFWFRIQQKNVPKTAVIVAAVLMTYAALVRVNGAFALGPLVLYCFPGSRKFSYKKILIASLLITAGGLLISLNVQKHVIRAKETQPVRSLQIFDLVGIAKNSGDLKLLAPLGPITQADVDRCYTAYWWDSIAPWGGCNFFSAKLMNTEFHAITSDRDIYSPNIELRRLWMNAIIAHPLAYAEHRLKLFNAATNFIVPAMVRRFGKNWIEIGPNSIKEDYVRKNFMTWPVLWLAVGVLILVALSRQERGFNTYPAVLLAASGTIYGSAYLLIGVASESRYMYWSILACVLALLLSLGSIKVRLKERDAATMGMLVLIALVLVLGFAARLGDWRFLLS